MRISDWSSDVCSSDLLDHGVREPAQRLQRVAQAGETGSRRHRLAALLQHHAAKPQVDIPEASRLGTQHVKARGGVVSDGVDDLQIPTSDARVDDLDRRQQEVDRSEEHTSELQSLMRLSYAVCCFIKNQNFITPCS